MKSIILALALLVASCSYQPAFAYIIPSPQQGMALEAPRKPVQRFSKKAGTYGAARLRKPLRPLLGSRNDTSYSNVLLGSQPSTYSYRPYGPVKNSRKRYVKSVSSRQDQLSFNSSKGCGPRPGAWCGWWMCTQLGPRVPNPNLARNWLKYGSPSAPQIGAVVVYNHHVAIIVGRDQRGWLVKSGNYSNRVAVHRMNYRQPIGIRA